jgi:hypothetical protein
MTILWRRIRRDLISAALFGVVAASAFMASMHGGFEFRV